MTTTLSPLKQLGRIHITGTLESLTGLHIGGTEVGLQIGGVDLSVVRNGLDGIPYIPGSSLKGKMRCLLERVYTPGTLVEVGKSRIYAPKCIEDYTDKTKGFVFHIFGVTPDMIEKLDKNKEKNVEALPTRLIVRDAMMTKETRERLERSLYTDMPYTQVKTEVVIDRITSAAMPRQIERVPAGAKFQFEMIFNAYFEDDLDLLKHLDEAMDLLEHDCLGGQGSRGYGQICFVERRVDAKWFNGADYDGKIKTWKAGFERPAQEGAAS